MITILAQAEDAATTGSAWQMLHTMPWSSAGCSTSS